ncbi:MAG: hypothetical protein WC934_01925 [Acidithiobacillus sp.]|jgi:hypothetical protein|uniref:hypothetical protein n=1 Tax=Acidithiobacillus sp. TaxID=1872118 RepID=UPI003560D2B3
MEKTYKIIKSKKTGKLYIQIPNKNELEEMLDSPIIPREGDKLKCIAKTIEGGATYYLKYTYKN